MRKCIPLLWVFLTLFIQLSCAQYNRPENFVWAMSYKTGLDFRNGAPVVIHTQLRPLFYNAHEASAALANANGLVFYSNGTTVWDSTGQIMPHGLRINGPDNNSESTSQGALIVPFPGQEKYRQFYLFSLNSIDRPGRLFCNKVNLDFNGGLGDIDTTFSLYHVVLDSALSEKMVSVPGCNGSIWLIVREKMNAVFRAYEINAAGINLTPVVSACGQNMNGGIFPGVGVLKAGPDGALLLGCYSAGVETYHFDKTTGIISNAQLLDSITPGTFGYYGCEFSPDGSKVYIKEYGGGDGSIWQYDLSAANPTATKTLLGLSYPLLNDLRLGPDQKIYFVAKTGYPNPRYIGLINAPNNAGTACGFQDSVTALAFDTAHLGKGNLGSTIVFPVYSQPLNIVFSNNVLSTTNIFSTYQWYKAGVAIPGATAQSCTATGAGWYSVKVTHTSGCSDSAAYEVTGNGNGTAVADPALLKKQIRIYPNPATDYLQLESPVRLRIALYSSEGRKLLETADTRIIDLRHMAPGLYFLHLLDAEGHFIKAEKIVVRTP